MNLNDFRPIVPSEEQIYDINETNKQYQDLADVILTNIASSAHRTAALRLLLESKMTLIHGITHPQENAKNV